MTALAGYWATGAASDPLQRCGRILAAQGRYGRDDASSARFGDLAVGRNLYRLLAEDSNDRQPLVSESGRYILIADLRLDNRDELADALHLPPGRLAGLADSDLALKTIERRGIDAVERLLGDFALACFDREREQLHLARSVVGHRPLFWHRGAGFVAFASMPSGLHAVDVPRAPDMEVVARYLALLHPRDEQSFFAGLRRVPPGHLVTITASSDGRKPFWAPERRELRLPSFEDYVEAYRAELDAAVARRLRGAGAIVASHLSGGWDSGAVTATAARLLGDGGRLAAFTAVPGRSEDALAPGSRFADESALAAATASLYPNVEHVLLPGEHESAIADLDRNFALFERPLFNLCNHVWLTAIRRAARERGARVLLTGEIGNWTISAAPTTLLADFLREGRVLAWAREAAAILYQRRARLRGVAANSFGSWLPGFLWRRLADLASTPATSEQSPLNPEWKGRFLSEQEGLRLGLPRPPKDNFRTTVAAIMEMDFGEYRKGVLAGWGIDKRDATSDRRLIEFCLSLPLDMLMKRVRRPLARAALADRLPPAVLDERSKGYQSPEWHVGLTRERDRIATLLDRIAADPQASSVVDVPMLRSLLRQWPAGGWHRHETIARYRIALLQGLSGGHFVLAASGSRG